MKYPELLGAYAGEFKEKPILVYRDKGNNFKGVYTGDDMLLLEDKLTIIYNTPEKVKELFDAGGAIVLGEEMPSKEYLNRTIKTLLEGYIISDSMEMLKKIGEYYNKELLKCLEEKFALDRKTLTPEVIRQLMGFDLNYKTLSLLDIRRCRTVRMYIFDEADGLWYKAIEEEHEQYCFISGFEVIAKSDMTLEKYRDTILEWACEDAFYNGWMALASIEDVIEYANENGDDHVKSIISYYKRYIKEREKYNQDIDMIAPEEITPELICKEFNSEFIKQKQPYRVKYGYQDKVIIFVLYKNNERIFCSILPVYFNYELKSNGINIPSAMVLAERYSRYRYGGYEGSGYWG